MMKHRVIRIMELRRAPNSKTFLPIMYAPCAALARMNLKCMKDNPVLSDKSIGLWKSMGSGPCFFIAKFIVTNCHFCRENILDNNSKPRYYKYVNKRKSPLAVAVPLIVTNLSQQLQRLQKSLPLAGGFRRIGHSFLSATL